jgi:hypothetical protein
MTSSRGVLLGVWIGTTALLGAGLLTTHLGMSQLDAANPAYQRPGFLDANPPRITAPAVAGLGGQGVRTVVFFTRADRLARLQLALAGPDGQALTQVARTVVVQDTGANAPSGVVSDPRDLISRSYVLRRPRDHRAPIGYAVVGPDGTIRYRTLDPQQDLHLSEALTMAQAT